MIRGIAAFFGAFVALFAEARLRKYLMLMMFVQIVVFGAVFVASGWGLSVLAEAYIPDADQWYWNLLEGVADVLAWISAVFVGLGLFLVFASALIAPFLEPMARIVRPDFQGNHTQSMVGLIVSSLSHSIRPMLGYLVWLIIGVFFWVIPVIGAMISSAIWFLAVARLFTHEALDVPASMLGWRWKERKGEIRTNRWFYLGVATPACALLTIPLVNMLVLPAAVIAICISLR